MVASTYPTDATSPPSTLNSALSAHKLVAGSDVGDEDKQWEKVIKIMTLEELLPMSFGPEQLGEAR